MQFFWWSRIGLPSETCTVRTVRPDTVVQTSVKHVGARFWQVTEQRELDLMSLVKRGLSLLLQSLPCQCLKVPAWTS